MTEKIKQKLKSYAIVLAVIYLLGLLVSLDFNWIEITSSIGRFFTIFVMIMVFAGIFDPNDFKNH